MATERQVEANRLNAAKSTGPKSDEGKARSRANAVKHGMAGEGTVVPAGMLSAFEGRREAWAGELRPRGEGGAWALDRAVAASLRVEACEQALDGLIDAQAERATIAWELDRRVDAAALAAGLVRNPTLVARKLEATRHGCELMIEVWERLGEAVIANGDWSEFERSTALDLLGVPAKLRDGRLPTDVPEGMAPGEFLRLLVDHESARLAGLKREVLDDLDDLERRRAEAGTVGLLSKQAGLVLRYERDAWRTYRAALAEIKNPPTVAPEPVPEPETPPRPAAPAPRSSSVPYYEDEAYQRATWPAPADDLPASSPLETFSVGISPPRQ